MKTERIFIMASALLVVLAAFFLWRNNFSAAFVTGALGAVAWFLSYRVRLRQNQTESENPIEENDIDSNVED